jgi:hypothetical protein
MKVYLIFAIITTSVLFSCKNTTAPHIPTPKSNKEEDSTLKITKEVYYDKVLGALVGSAIGDAMGASTEMWYRKDIQDTYGYITGLTPATREKSPEGTWDHNMVSGATTDDTRWKYFLGRYLIDHSSAINKATFTDFIIDYYQGLTRSISDDDIGKSTDLLDQEMEKVNWIKEWARVSLAFKESPEAYEAAKSRFYGGEMSCAGMLYAPMFGLITTTPTMAYQAGYEHALFDLGYAKDITALTASMTQLAMQDIAIDSIISLALLIDPKGYADSRLIGRLPLKMVNESLYIVDKAKEIQGVDSNIKVPNFYTGNAKEWNIQNDVYSELEKKQKAIPFHAGEIWQILITGLHYGQGDYLKTMQFIVNYGRDNDTVAAIAGMILGAKIGYTNLPKDEKEKILNVTENVIGIDLESLAKEIADTYYPLLQ